MQSRAEQERKVAAGPAPVQDTCRGVEKRELAQAQADRLGIKHGPRCEDGRVKQEAHLCSMHSDKQTVRMSDRWWEACYLMQGARLKIYEGGI